jgi:periplasmic protein TonB
MKRKNEKVPGFDEIIFENRNKEYGAYNLRKNADSATSVSILGVIVLSGLITAALSITPEKGKASDGPEFIPIVHMDPVFTDPVSTVAKPPAGFAGIMKNAAPVVTSDPYKDLNTIPPNDDLLKSVKNGHPDDSTIYNPADDPVVPEVKEPFVRVEEMPEFPGGEAELLKFISNNILYPQDAISNNIQGRVILRFAVNTDGSIDRIQILRGIDNSLDSEAVRVVRTLPKFKPGKQRGVPVPVWFSLPVLFRLENN